MRGLIFVRPETVVSTQVSVATSDELVLYRRSRLWTGICLALAGLLVLPGCGLFQMGKDISKASWRQFRPKTRDYADPINDPNSADYHDEWETVGSEGRGEQSYEKESDGLTKWISSPKARSIERNLGVE